MTLNFQTVEHLTRTNGIKVVVYGQAKVGKTCLIGTCPNPIIFSAERGLLSLRNNPATRNIVAAEIHSIKDFTDARDWCLKSAEAKKFDTYCLDSISEIAEICLIEEKEKTAISTPKGKKPNGFEPYMALGDQVMGVLREFRDFPGKHVMFIAKQEFDKDGDTGISMFRPSMPGRQLTNQLPFMFDEILQLVRFTQKNEQGMDIPYNALRTSADSQNVAGDRSGSLDLWEPANISHIINKIINSGK